MQIERKHRNDLLLIGGILFAALLSLGILMLVREEGNRVAVIQNGIQTASYPLDTDRTVTVSAEDGGSNTFCIEQKSVRMFEADCPDALCIRQGKITHNGQTIVCLPHKLVLKIISNEKTEVDVRA